MQTVVITETQFNDLAHYPTSSWALWSDGFNKKGCTEDMPGQPEKFSYRRAEGR
jgi:hypothetical protein